MKKNIIFLLVLMLLICVVCNATDPVLVQDSFCEGKAYVYIPIDGTYWHRVDLGWPKNSSTSPLDELVAIQNQCYGIVRPGSHTKAIDMTWNGAHFDDQVGQWARSSTNILNDYAEVIFLF